MTDNRSLIVRSIVKFLRKELAVGGHDDDCVESLEVAVQCIESAFAITDPEATETPLGEVIPNLDDIFRNLRLSGSTTIPECNKVADEHKNRGNALMQLEKYNEALEEYTKAIQIYDKNAVYFCNRAAAYSKLEQHDKAVEDSKCAIQLDPNYGKAYGRLGIAYASLRKYDDAKVSYKKALELEPDNRSYRNNLLITEDLQQREKQRDNPQNLGGAGDASAEAPLLVTQELENVMHENIDQMLSNPNIVNIASQFLGNPEMRNIMQSVFETNMIDATNFANTSNFSAIVNAGQQLMDQLQNSNPEIVDQLRRVARGQADPSTDQPPTDNPNGS